MENTKAIERTNYCEEREESEDGIELNGPMGEGMAPSTSIIAASASSDDTDPPTPMFMLIVDCFDHLFEWLTLSQLLVFRLTCKRMHLVVNQYIKRDYPKLQVLKINEHNRWLEFCQMPLIRFKWIKRLAISNLQLNLGSSNNIHNVLNKLEILELKNVQIDGDLYEVILKHCKHLKALYLFDGGDDTVVGPTNSWLLRSYPTLERFHIYKNRATTTPLCPELLTFFDRNPNIRSFGIDAAFLEQHRQLFLTSKLNFTNLVLLVNFDVDLVHNLITDLHKHGFFKVLMVRDYNFIFSSALQYPSYAFNLKTLSLEAPPLPGSHSIPVVESLKWLDIKGVKRFEYNTLEQMAKNFINLSCVSIDGNLNDIAQFVRYAPKLKEITFRKFTDETVDMWEVWAVNELRKRLAGAHKITIFIEEKSFMAIKWAGRSNWSMIEWKPSR